MITFRRAVLPCLVAVAVAGVAGCVSSNGSAVTGSRAPASAAVSSAVSSSPSSSPSGDPLAGLGTYDIITQAVSDTRAAASVRVASTGSDAGTSITYSVSIKKGSGCEGTLSEGATGGYQLVMLGAQAWIKPDLALWKSFGYGAPARLSAVSGKWVPASMTRSGVAGLSAACSLDDIIGSEVRLTGLVKGSIGMVDGQRALELTSSTGAATVWVSDAAAPVLVRIVDTSSGGGTFDFTQYGAPVTISPPPADQVIASQDLG